MIKIKIIYHLMTTIKTKTKGLQTGRILSKKNGQADLQGFGDAMREDGHSILERISG